MNKRCYKLRFCHVRQMLIPVAEFVKRASKPSPGINIDSTDNEYIRSFFSSLSNSISQIALFTSSQARCFPNVKQLAATLPLAMLAIWPQPGFAQEASGGLPPEDKSTVTALPLNPAPPLVSKIPDPELIHIMTPDVKGISHNTKKVFNVEPSGVIFNNSLVSGTRSYLFNGQLMANPNLKGKAADVILMEVTGYEPTYIKGRMEINGQKADLLIANPKGITLNGDITTINTNSLTTNNRVFQRLKDGFEFAVSEGKITLKGNMDTRFVKSVGNLRAVQQDALTNFDIVALSVEIIGNIGMGSAEGLADEKTDLNIIAGPNNFAFPSREITKSRAPEETNEEKNHDTASEQNKEKKPNRGIAAFGTMYGRNITMVSTGSGAGVLHAGSILSADDIVISATDGGSVDLDNIMAPGKVALSGHNVSLGVNRSEEIKEIKVTKVNRDADLANQKKPEAGKKEDKNSAPEQAERDKTLADKKKAEGSNTQDKKFCSRKERNSDLLVIKPGAVSVYIHRELSVQAKNAITLLGDQHVEGIAAFEAPTIILEPESGLRAGSAFLKAEDLHLGWLGYLSSRIKLEGDLSNISNRGRLVSGDKINLNVSNKLENYKGAGIYGVQELSMTSGGDVTNHGLISSLATINMSVGGFLSNMSTGTILTDALHTKGKSIR